MSKTVSLFVEAERVAKEIGYPVRICAAHPIRGELWHIARNEEQLSLYWGRASADDRKGEVTIAKH